MESPDPVCVRFAALCLGNLTLEEEGRAAIAEVDNSMFMLLNTIRSPDMDIQRFALQALGNMLFHPQARELFLSIRGGLEVMRPTAMKNAV